MNIYFLLQTYTGRDILAAEIILVTADATWECGGCGAAPFLEGALAGEVAGGMSAAQSGGDVLNGVAVGGVVGGATGYLGGEISQLKVLQEMTIISDITLANMASGAIGGFGTGVAFGYAGGQGDMNTMLSNGLSTAPIGAVIGGVMGMGKLSGGAWGGMSAAEKSLFLSFGRGIVSGTKLFSVLGPAILSDENVRTNNAVTTSNTTYSYFANPYVNFNFEQADILDYLISSRQGTRAMIKSLTVTGTGY